VRLLTERIGFVLATAITFVAAVARTGALFNVIPVLARDRLGLGADRIGVGLALASLVGLLLIYPSGMLVDRFGRKMLIVPGTIMSAAAMLVFLLTPSYAWFLTACVVWSLATGVSVAAPAVYAADVAPPGMNAAAMSTFRMLPDAGYVLGPLALGLIADLFGANVALATAALLLAAVAVLFARYAPESFRR
jgi:MFS family permease